MALVGPQDHCWTTPSELNTVGRETMVEVYMSEHRSPERPYSAACDRNREPIRAVLRDIIVGGEHVLEIGSGTGQHAVYFARAFPEVSWQTSDLAENHSGIRAWIDASECDNLVAPLSLDVRAQWPQMAYDLVFTANTAHIMAWEEVCCMLAGTARLLKPNGHFVIYGPFRYGGAFTSDSNARFDAALRQSVPHRGIRDFEAVVDEARRRGLVLERDHAMPANNQCLVFIRKDA